MINPKKKNGSILIHAVGDVLVNRDDPDSIGYGSVCPVVWEGEGREASPYPNCNRRKQLTNEISDL